MDVTKRLGSWERGQADPCLAALSRLDREKLLSVSFFDSESGDLITADET